MSNLTWQQKLKKTRERWALKFRTWLAGANLTWHVFSLLAEADFVFRSYGCTLEKLESMDDGGVRLMWMHPFVAIYVTLENHDLTYCRVISRSNSALLLEHEEEDFVDIVTAVYLHALDYARHYPVDFGHGKDSVWE